MLRKGLTQILYLCLYIIDIYIYLNHKVIIIMKMREKNIPDRDNRQ